MVGSNTGVGAPSRAEGSKEGNVVQQTDTRGDAIFRAVITVLVIGFSLITLYPVVILISNSFSDGYAIMAGKVLLWPVDVNLAAYRLVLKHKEIGQAYLNTITYTLVGTAINIVLTTLGAYPLSRKNLYGRSLLMMFFAFTMFFSGGMIPAYLNIRNLGLLNTIWALVLPGAVSVWNMIIMRTFFQNTIPDELWESAAIDGANDLTFFLKVVLPLSGTIMAVMVLFYGVGHWNAWFSAMIYMSTRSKYPLQLILREIITLSSSQDLSGAALSDAESVGEAVKYATMMVATLPIMCLYPFLQRYFVKGVMLGSIKG